MWAKGDLDWVLTWSGPEYQPPEARRRILPSVAELDAEPEEKGEEEEGENEEEAA